MSADDFHDWVESLALVVMLVLAMLAALYAVRNFRRPQPSLKASGLRLRLSTMVPRLGLLGLALVTIFAFTRVAREMVEGETTKMDRVVALAVHGIDTPALDLVMRGFTFMGSAFAIGPVALAVLAWACLKRETRAALVLVIVVVLTEALNLALKQMFERPRPTLFQEIETLYGYSFPSGHAMAAVGIYGIIGVIVSRLLPKHRRGVTVALCVLIAMICISRVYLGVHWPTDILAGAAAGAFVLLAGAMTLAKIPSAVQPLKPTE